MKNIVVTAIVGFALCSLAAQTPSSKEKLVGTWRLVSRVVTSEDGRVLSDSGLGATPVGLLIYDSTGHMAGQLMRPSRSAMGDCSVSVADVANNTQTVCGYDAYFGEYTIDENKHTIVHHVEGALAPIDVGKNLVRHFELQGDTLKLVLTTESPQGKEIRTLTWERIR